MLLTTPIMLAGLGAVAIPVLIHYLLRPRPQRVRFPATPWMRDALVRGQGMQRIRHIRLLMARAALLACVALLLAGPTCRQATLAHDDGSRCTILVVDDSFSVRDRGADQRTRLDALCTLAEHWIPQPDTAQPAATLGLITACGLLVEPTTSVSRVREHLRRIADQPIHARALGAALRRAAGWLAASARSRRRLVVFTDGAAHAWRDVEPGLLAGLGDLEVVLVTPERAASTNLALIGLSGPRRVHTFTAPAPLRARVRSDGVDARVRLVVREAGEVLVESPPVSIAAGHVRDVDLLIPPLPIGVNGLRVTVEPEDRLLVDQSRFVAIECGRRPVVWLVGSRSAEQWDLTSVLVGNLLAPSALPDDAQRVRLVRLDGDGVADAPTAGEQRPALIVVTGDAGLSQTGRQALRGLVRAGSTLVLVARADAAVHDWPGLRSLVAAAPPEVQRLDAPQHMRLEQAVAGSGLDELSRCAVFVRLRLGALRAGVRRDAAYDDGQPAIVSTTLGSGRIIMLTTSPDPSWSELGVRAAGLLSWLHALVDAHAGRVGRVLNLVAHTTADAQLTGVPDGRLAWQKLGAADKPSRSLLLAGGRPTDGWPTNEPGLFALKSGSAVQALVAVNWPAQESDPMPVSTDRLARRLGAEDVQIRRGQQRPAERKGWAAWIASVVEPEDWLAGVLLVLVVSELWLSRRAQ